MHARTGKTTLILMLLFAVVLYGCSAVRKPAATQPPAVTTEAMLNNTQAAETISAELTRVAPPTDAIQAPQALPTDTPTEEQLPPTSTPLPTDTPLPSDTPLPTNTPLPSPTPIPLESPTATQPPEPAWQLAFSDDFVASRFWSESRGETFSLDYGNGGYRIRSSVVGDIIFSTRTDNFSSVRVETVGRRITGPLDSYFGPICNFINGGNYYMFAVGSDGWFGIIKKEKNKINFLKEGTLPAGTLQTGAEGITIRGDCYSGQLVLWVNGVQQASVRDLSFTSGAIGIGVGARKMTGIEAVFTSFSAYTPAQPPAAQVSPTP